MEHARPLRETLLSRHYYCDGGKMASHLRHRPSFGGVVESPFGLLRRLHHLLGVKSGVKYARVSVSLAPRVRAGCPSSKAQKHTANRRYPILLTTHFFFFKS